MEVHIIMNLDTLCASIHVPCEIQSVAIVSSCSVRVMVTEMVVVVAINMLVVAEVLIIGVPVGVVIDT